ncbi:MAG: M16 family metallopeptidase [Nitritalea sp.]
MIDYHRFTLENGLDVLVHEDHSSKIAVVNLLYKVGSRNERLGKTGLAHYFEHLMFGGSQHIPYFDTEVERAGGSCNAFTSPDLTNYYITLPAVNLETAFWLESDRMYFLRLGEKSIETQRKVVVEEFKQRYLNQPYGDAMHHLRDEAYQQHAYKWPTIGAQVADIEGYTREDVAHFYAMHYRPDNAILVVAGGVSVDEVRRLAEKWFDRKAETPFMPQVPLPEASWFGKKTKTVFADVPTDALYKAYRIAERKSTDYLKADLLSDMLAFGKSSLLEQQLVKKGKHFASISAYVTGSIDPGLLIFSGKMEDGVSAEEGEQALDACLSDFLAQPIAPEYLQKIKNQAEAMQTYEEIQLINRAMRLAMNTFMGDPDFSQHEYARKMELTAEDVAQYGRELLAQDSSVSIYYKKQNA